MTSTIKTMLTLACVSLATLALAGCGGGDSTDKTGKTGGSGSSGSGTSASQEGPAYRVMNDFVNHMANGEYAQARELTDNGGAATILDKYVEMSGINGGNENLAPIMEAVFSGVTERFAAAGVEVVETTENSATVRLTVGGKSHDVEVASLDGATWTIALPQGALTPLEDLMGNAGNAVIPTRP